MSRRATTDELEAKATSIADDVWEARLELPGGDNRWIGYNSSRGKPVIVGQNGLYGGQLGVAVFFAATSAVTGDARYRRYADDAADSFFETDVTNLLDDVDLGAGAGVGSYIYGLTVISELLDDDAYLDLAGELVRALSRETIAGDNRYSVLCGAAGAIHALLRYWEHTGDSEALEKAIRCGEHLLENSREKWNGYEVWDTSRESQPHRIRTGMGHGVGGISYALYRLYEHADREAFRRVAENAVSFENVFYSDHENNWKANPTTIDNYPLWWCYGLVGIGNARLGSLEHHESARLARDLDRARRGLDPRLTTGDSLCHGTFAQVDFLVELGRRDDDQYLETARQLAGRAFERRQDEGSYRVAFGDVPGLYNPVLFLGTAGIGYTLLRLLRPETLPCVLRFE